MMNSSLWWQACLTTTSWDDDDEVHDNDDTLVFCEGNFTHDNSDNIYPSNTIRTSNGGSLLDCHGLLDDEDDDDNGDFDRVIFDEQRGSIPDAAQKQVWAAAVSRLLSREDASGYDFDMVNNHQNKNDNNMTQLQPILQSENWDCGVACLQMVLQWLRHGDKKISRPQLQQERLFLLRELGTQSIWTADLVSLLDRILSWQMASASNQNHTKHNHNHSPAARYLFTSSSLEVDQAYGNFSYYEQSFAQDATRVQRIFGHLRRHDKPVLHVNHLSIQQVRWIVSQPNAIALVLVDNTLLRCSCHGGGGGASESTRQQEHKQGASTTTSADEKQSGNSSFLNQNNHNHDHQHQLASELYTGHYILLVGSSEDPEHLKQSCHYDSFRNKKSNVRGNVTPRYCFVAYNPGRHPCSDAGGRMYIAADLLEQAWRAEGTDEDIIFIVKQQEGSS